MKLEEIIKNLLSNAGAQNVTAAVLDLINNKLGRARGESDQSGIIN